MWQRFQNILHSFSSYAELSPDLTTRRQVKRFLRDRPSFSVDDWFETFWKERDIAKPISVFVYIHLSKYSGLDFAKVQPGDRLNEDLQLPLVCWHDWQLSLYDDFWQSFGVDLSDHLDHPSLTTVEDLMTFLNHQMRLAKHC